MSAVRDCWGSSGDAASMSNIHTFFFSFDHWCILSKTALLSSDIHDMRFHLNVTIHLLERIYISYYSLLSNPNAQYNMLVTYICINGKINIV